MTWTEPCLPRCAPTCWPSCTGTWTIDPVMTASPVSNRSPTAASTRAARNSSLSGSRWTWPLASTIPSTVAWARVAGGGNPGLHGTRPRSGRRSLPRWPPGRRCIRGHRAPTPPRIRRRPREPRPARHRDHLAAAGTSSGDKADTGESAQHRNSSPRDNVTVPQSATRGCDLCECKVDELVRRGTNPLAQSLRIQGEWVRPARLTLTPCRFELALWTWLVELDRQVVWSQQ